MTQPKSREDLLALVDQLREQATQAETEEEMRLILARVKDITQQLKTRFGIGIPATPIGQALEIDSKFRERAHLTYLGERVAKAVDDVEHGENRMLVVSMPPRSGKSTTLSLYTPLWFLRKHPDWKIITASFDGTLTGEWARNVRSLIEDNPDLGITLMPDGGAGSRWSTKEGGGIYSASIRSPLTGRGARVMLIDDPIKDYVDAHSATMRDALWNWWLSVAQTRLEPPYLVIVVMTRWHEDDIVGRLLSQEHEGDPKQWEVISIPAVAGKNDALGREVDEPLISPLLDENVAQAAARWEETKRTVGTYVWSSMYLQTPAPAKGAIFDVGWWRYWTTDPAKATDDGKVVYLDPDSIKGGQWLDSWDMAFKDSDSSDYVVGQRWVKHEANRYLLMQVRERMSFTTTLKRFEAWSKPTSLYGRQVHQRLVEDKANGPAIINTMRSKVSGIKAITPKDSKAARARNVTPEIESGNVYLPHPTDPGNEWVLDFISESRNFPYDAHDDQVDAATQALQEMKDPGLGKVTVPGNTKKAKARQIERRVGSGPVRRATNTRRRAG